jgi:hypothetical protein
MPPQPDAASGDDREQKHSVVLAAVVFGNVPDGLQDNARQADAGKIAVTLRPVSLHVAEGLLAG